MAAVKLAVEDGVFAYKNSPTVLNHISFAADTGDLVAILGPNGAGKTTLMRCAMGFLRWRSGVSTLDGRDIRSIPYGELWRSIAYVPQARGVVSPYSALEMVLLGRSSRVGVFSQPVTKDLAAAEKVMNELGVWPLRNKRCSEVSGGELQLILIARALAAEPRVLILDEPESNLDFRNQLLIMETLSRLAAEGMTCLFNTHYPAHAMRWANKALLLSAAGESLFGDVNTVVTEENIHRAFGVRAVISEVETPMSVTRDIIPIMVSTRPEGELRQSPGGGRRLATVSVIAAMPAADGQINALLHEYGAYIIGRMGMPYPEGGVNILNVNLDAPEEVISALTQRLGILPGVSVKATYARCDLFEGRERRDQPGTD